MEEKLPKNIRCVGQVGDDKKIFVEEYVVSFLQETVREKAEPQMLVLYGDGYEQNGCRYYFLKGAASHEASGSIFGKKDELYFQTIGKKYFPGWKAIGWYCTKGNRACEEVLKILQNTCEQNFHDVKGYSVYFEKNPNMEEYMLHHKRNKNDTVVTNKKRDEKKEGGKSGRRLPPILAMQILNMISLCILIICCIIAVTTLNQYDKMKRLEETVNYLEVSMEEQKNLPEE